MSTSPATARTWAIPAARPGPRLPARGSYGRTSLLVSLLLDMADDVEVIRQELETRRGSDWERTLPLDTPMRKSAVHTGPYTIDPFDPFAGPAGGQTDMTPWLPSPASAAPARFWPRTWRACSACTSVGGCTFIWSITTVSKSRTRSARPLPARDLDKYKAQVVAERLVRQFPIEVSVSLAPYDHLRDAPYPRRHDEQPRLALLIGCVDNPNARHELALTLEPPVLRGSSNRLVARPVATARHQVSSTWAMPCAPKVCEEPSTLRPGLCRALPAPSIQAPELLEAPTAPLPVAQDQDCAEAQIAGDQEPFVNRTIAALGLAMVARLCQRRLTWRATFFDLDAGTLYYTPADPHDIASLMGMRTESMLRRHRFDARASA